MNETPKILQLMPARPGWEVAFLHLEEEDKDYGGNAWHTCPLECLALVEYEDEGERYTKVVGVVKDYDWANPEFELVEPSSIYFVAYTRSDNPFKDLEGEALERRRQLKEIWEERQKARKS